MPQALVPQLRDAAKAEGVASEAEEEGLEPPYSCRAGSCASFAGKVLKGSFAQCDQALLGEDQLNAGYSLTCVAYPTL